MPNVNCVTLGLGAQHTGKYTYAPKLAWALSPRTLVVRRYESCEKFGPVFRQGCIDGVLVIEAIDSG